MPEVIWSSIQDLQIISLGVQYSLGSLGGRKKKDGKAGFIGKAIAVVMTKILMP